MAKKEITNSQVVKILRKEISGVRDGLKKDISGVKSDLKATEKRLTKKIDEDTEFLARITQDGFREAEVKHNKAHKIIRKRIREVESNASGTRKIAMSKVERDDRQDLKIKLINKKVKVLEKQVL